MNLSVKYFVPNGGWAFVLQPSDVPVQIIGEPMIFSTAAEAREVGGRHGLIPE